MKTWHRSSSIFARCRRSPRAAEDRDHLPGEVPDPLGSPAGYRAGFRADPNDRLKWGEYLVRMSWCAECHTPSSKGQSPPGMDFAGGFLIDYPGGTPVASANITPDPSGISYYDEDLFIQAIRTGKVRARQLSSFMPEVPSTAITLTMT